MFRSLFRSVPFLCYTLCIGSLFIHWFIVFSCLVYLYFGFPRNISRYSSVFQIPVSYPILVQYNMIHHDGILPDTHHDRDLRTHHPLPQLCPHCHERPQRVQTPAGWTSLISTSSTTPRYRWLIIHFLDVWSVWDSGSRTLELLLNFPPGSWYRVCNLLSCTGCLPYLRWR